MTPFARNILTQILLIAAPIFVGCNAESRVECVQQLTGGACRVKTDPALLSEFQYDYCVEGIDSVNELVSHDGTLCCYDVTFDPDLAQPCDGRPLRDGERLIVASAECVTGWSHDEPLPNSTELSWEQRIALRDAWAASALTEHASIASFARAALELLAVGAPATLVTAVQTAGLDEIHHAQMCFTLASRYAQAPVGPGPLSIGAAMAQTPTLATLAAETARDGCVNETLAALLASERLARANDPHVRSVLAIIAEDEMRHALLAWQTVRWALHVGGSEVHNAVEQAFSKALHGAVEIPKSDPIADSILADHGVLPAAEVRAVITKGLKQVLRPSIDALLTANILPCVASHCDRKDSETTMTI